MVCVRLLGAWVASLLVHSSLAAFSGKEVTTEPPNPKDLCPPGLAGSLEVFKCKCYQFQKTNTYWGNNKCTVNGGHLAKLDTKEINDFLQEKSRVHIPDEIGAWIGARRETDDHSFFWTDGTPVLNDNWADGEPDDLIAISQNCVYIKKSRFYRWATLQCSMRGFGPTIPSICQYDIANCTGPVEIEKFDTTLLIVVIVGSVLGGLIVCLIFCCIISRCRSAYRKYHKKKSRRRSVRYYSRPPSTARQSSGEPRFQNESNEKGENDLNERLVQGAQAGDDDILNVKESALPTANSIAADASQRKGLLVDMHTGRATVKRINAPARNRADDTSDRGPCDREPCDLSAEVPADEARVSINFDDESDDENNGVLANLDNVDKPSNHPSKDVFSK